MSGRPIYKEAGLTLPFFMPNVVGTQYRPGRQPYNPGESQMDGQQWPQFHAIPWPRPVASIIALANSPGIPRDRALQISNNSTAPYPANVMFLGGVVAKSQG